MLGELDELVSLFSNKRVKDILSQCVLIELPFRVGWFISMLQITNSTTVLIMSSVCIYEKYEFCSMKSPNFTGQK